MQFRKNLQSRLLYTSYFQHSLSLCLQRHWYVIKSDKYSTILRVVIPFLRCSPLAHFYWHVKSVNSRIFIITNARLHKSKQWPDGIRHVWQLSLSFYNSLYIMAWHSVKQAIIKHFDISQTVFFRAQFSKSLFQLPHWCDFRPLSDWFCQGWPSLVTNFLSSVWHRCGRGLFVTRTVTRNVLIRLPSSF